MVGCVLECYLLEIRIVELMCVHFTSLTMIGSGDQLVWAVNLIWKYWGTIYYHFNYQINVSIVAGVH